jgi:hypothetical protein
MTDAERIAELERDLADRDRTIALLMEAGRKLARELRLHGIWTPSRFRRRVE